MVTEGLQVHQVVVQAEDVRLALVVDDTRVIAACTPRAVHDVSHRTPWSRRLVAHRITDAFRAAGRGKGQVPVLTMLIQPGALLIVFDVVVEFVYLALQRNHILVEQCPIGVRVAPVQIGLSVVVNPNRRVDVVPVFLLPKQGFSQRIDERSIGRISHQHTDAMSMNRAVHIELAVPFDHLLGPGTVVVVVPLEVLQRSHCTVVGPVHHVGRSVEQPVLHHEAVGAILVMRCIKEDRVVIDHRSRVGCVFRLDDGQVHGRIELPPVQVEEFAITATEEQIDVVHARSLALDGSLDHHVVVVHGNAGNGPAVYLVEEEVYRALALEVQHLHGHQRSRHVAEVHVAHPDPVSVVNRGHIVTVACQSVHLHTPALCHRLGLHHLVGIDRAQRLHTLFGEGNEGERTIGIKRKLLDARCTTEAASIGQGTVVIEHVVVALEVDVAAMYRETVLSLTHDLAAIGPRSIHGGSCRIGHMLGHTARSIHGIVGTVALGHPGSFLVLCHHAFTSYRPVHLRLQFAEALRVGVSGYLAVTVLERLHILVQTSVPEALVAPEEVGRAVVVDEDGRVDESEAHSQRLAQRIHIGSLRFVGHGHSQRILALSRVAAHVPVPLPVPFHGLCSPCLVTLLCPFEGRCAHRCAQVGPVHHVLCREEQPVLHLEVRGVILVMIHKQIHLVAMHVGCRVRRIDRSNHRVLRLHEAPTRQHHRCYQCSFLHINNLLPCFRGRFAQNYKKIDYKKFQKKNVLYQSSDPFFL